MNCKAFGLILALLATPALAGPYQPVDVSRLPQSKQTGLGLYLSAPEAFKMKSEGGAKVLFIDVRTRGEFQFVGASALVDRNIPLIELDSPPRWDARSGRYAMSLNPDFVADVSALAARMNIGKGDPIIVMCRSGERSARAADLLQAAGYGKVYSVVDGFEGDMSRNGRREVNGWKNADLPWTYTMTEGQASVR
ncbi:rhodanese-related sulfurtransferase [Rhodoblastus acidophilus]|uniref:rhodanese-like domain-containing protein n=1 Tax=Rhodoblastus acidophilus TaxID=1074 RepID=UPI002224C08A|nr:rhodanese-like domain-containing protein [Rhodoblastus acidophilus]MCW2318435.1 rhodanese-related sulfurtransferase [Rhodoblastus acidophilus]